MTRRHESGFISLHTGCCILEEVHLISRNLITLPSLPDMRNENHCHCVTVFATSISWKQLSLSKCSVPLPPSPLPSFKVTSLFAQCCAIGVMLRLCCVICCYASTSGMWSLSLFFFFYSRSLHLCQKRTNNLVTTIGNHGLMRRVMKLRKAVPLVCVMAAFGDFLLDQKVRFICEFILCICVKAYTE